MFQLLCQIAMQKKQIKSIKEKTDRPNLFLEKREQKRVEGKFPSQDQTLIACYCF